MTKDIVRQIVNIIATVAVIALNLFGDQLTGRTVGELANKYPVPVTPSGYTFAVWSVIYLGLAAFAIYQALPSQRENPRLRRIGYWYALSCFANVAWEFIWLNELINLSILPMLLIFFALFMLYTQADMNRTNVSSLERWCVNIPFGIYFGWITIAMTINVAVVLKNLGWNGLGIAPATWTIVLLLIAATIAFLMGIQRVDIAYVATVAWAFQGILTKNLSNTPIVVVSGVLIAILLATIVFIALRRKELRSNVGSPFSSGSAITAK